MDKTTLQAPAKALPVTLLSGFLGSGKTTLLEWILQSDHGYKIAVIVNDIGAINIDADKIKKNYHIAQAGEKKVIPLQNGCICCTLRGDLLEELVRLSKLEQFDYIIIESSGISEPEQVAETFDNQLAEQIANIGDLPEEQGLDKATIDMLVKLNAAGGLEKFARLDTTVTVIDAFTIMNDFNTADILSSRRDDVPSEDDRTVTDLMVDQIEFADVIVLNKVGMVDAKAKESIFELIRKLNHRAKIVESNYGRIDVKKILGTALFDLERAKAGYGWLEDIHAMTVHEVNGKKMVTPKPETEEYNVRNFVYARHRPFHPERLYTLLYDKFILQFEEGVAGDDDEDEDEEDEEMDDVDVLDGLVEEEEDDDITMDSDEDEGSTPATSRSASSLGKEIERDVPEVPDDATILANKRNSPLFARLFRSKGHVFFATRPHWAGEWSQAGAMMLLQGSGPWLCTLPKEEITTDNEEINSIIQHDIKSGGEWGDRRQEIVFIGEKLDIAGLQKALDECLLDDKEYKQWEKIMRNKKLDDEQKIEKLEEHFSDGFPDWETEEDHEGHNNPHPVTHTITKTGKVVDLGTVKVSHE